MSYQKTPVGWAARISDMLDAVHAGMERFPIDVREVVTEYSKMVFPKEPITLIQAGNFSDAFEGALIPNPERSEWGIVYNQATQHMGRINFTIAHEFGHYLLHRHLLLHNQKCSRHDMATWQSNETCIECEANEFASNLLMPALDFWNQIHDKTVSKNLILNLAKRYKVSISAAALRWLSFSKDRAMIISSKDGYIDWSWSNKKLIKSGIFYSAKKSVTELPKNSLAVDSDNTENERFHPPSMWLGDEEIKEILLYRASEHALLLLIYPEIETPDDTAEEEIAELDGILNFKSIN